MLVIMHYSLFMSHYAGFGTHSKLSNFWIASDSLWVEPLLSPASLSPDSLVTPLSFATQGSATFLHQLYIFISSLMKVSYTACKHY